MQRQPEDYKPLANEEDPNEQLKEKIKSELKEFGCSIISETPAGLYTKNVVKIFTRENIQADQKSYNPHHLFNSIDFSKFPYWVIVAHMIGTNKAIGRSREGYNSIEEALENKLYLPVQEQEPQPEQYYGCGCAI